MNRFALIFLSTVACLGSITSSGMAQVVSTTENEEFDQEGVIFLESDAEAPAEAQPALPVLPEENNLPEDSLLEDSLPNEEPAQSEPAEGAEVPAEEPDSYVERFEEGLE